MASLVFAFVADASGSPDPITIPVPLSGSFRKLLIIPPVGHAWTYYDPTKAVGAPMTMDEEYELVRHDGEGAFVAGETVAAAALDTGSGTFTGVLS